MDGMSTFILQPSDYGRYVNIYTATVWLWTVCQHLYCNRMNMDGMSTFILQLYEYGRYANIYTATIYGRYANIYTATFSCTEEPWTDHTIPKLTQSHYPRTVTHCNIRYIKTPNWCATLMNSGFVASRKGTGELVPVHIMKTWRQEVEAWFHLFQPQH